MVYTINRLLKGLNIDMETAKIFQSGRSQAVRLPKEFRFFGEEVGIKKVGEVVLLYPKDSAWANFMKSQPVSDDFASGIIENRQIAKQPPRESL